ncbi:hypothetical protein ACFFSY_24450 [Paenibacillus aurantiacus]|uniref:DNA/RNA non-specific endonuclease n=1 Tax=Paenibacillus aurantiacus TaxID=1936118 RepID=A0ABV5KV34_9BACL
MKIRQHKPARPEGHNLPPNRKRTEANGIQQLQRKLGNQGLRQLLAADESARAAQVKASQAMMEEQKDAEQEYTDYIEPEAFRRPFQTFDKENHTLCIEQEGEGWRLVMHSEPTPLGEHLERIRDWIENNGSVQQKTDYERACELAEEIDRGIAPRGAWAAWRPQDGDEVERRLAELSVLMESLPGDEYGNQTGAQARPASTAAWTSANVTISDGRGGTVASTDGRSVDAVVTVNPGALRGTEPQAGARSPLLQAVNALTGGQATYIAGHLLNHHLHGKGDAVENLAPISATANRLMESNFEKSAKQAVLGENKVLSYRVTATYPGGRDDSVGPESSLPTSLDVQIREYEFDNAHGDTAVLRKDIDNWTLTGPALYSQGNYPLHRNNDYVRIESSIVQRAQDHIDKVNHFINNPAFGTLRAPLQVSANQFLTDGQQIVNDPNLMHNYLTHEQKLVAMAVAWNALENDLMIALPRGKRKR